MVYPNILDILSFFPLVLESNEPRIPTPTSIALTDTSSISTGGVLRSKELRSVVETKRRNFSRSASSSDSEDNGSNHEISRLIHNRKNTRSPSSLDDLDCPITNRGRSFSNVEHDISSNMISASNTFSNNGESTKRRSGSSRANSLVSTNRSVLSNINDENATNTSGTISLPFFADRTRSLSTEHRLANHSQMSIASRTSIRYCTPRESTVFTKTEAPPVVRLLQQTPHHDPIEVIKTLIEHQRQDHIQTAIIVEEDTAPAIPLLSDTNHRTSFRKKRTSGTSKSNIIAPSTDEMTRSNGHLPSNSMFSSLKYSLIKQRKSSRKQRACCTVF